MSIIAGIVGFMLGCVVWNYFGPVIKGWLHIGERDLGNVISQAQMKARADAWAAAKAAEDKIKSKL